MKKLIVLGFILFWTFSSKAQMYATPNSEWYYSRISINGPSYSQITLGGTITINSQVCRQLNYFNKTFFYSSGTTYTTSQIPYRYVYENNKVVYLYNQNTNNFDTLYNYNAAIGSKWLLPAIYTNTFFTPCNRTILTVIDTGHATISGVNLKWLKTDVDTIYERIGFLTKYYFQYDNCTSPYDYNEGGYLRCFNDNQIINYNKTGNVCNYLYSSVSVKENNINNYFKIYPNPFNSVINLEFYGFSENSATIFEFKIVNTLGQVVQTSNIQNQTTALNISNLKIGIYFLQVFNNKKLIGTRKIVKE